MSDKDRNDAALSAMLGETPTICGKEIRKFTAAHIALASRAGITMLFNNKKPGDEEELTEADQIQMTYEATAMLYLLTRPAKESLNELKAGTFEENVFEFMEGIDMNELGNLQGGLTSYMSDIAEYAVEPDKSDPKSGSGQKKTTTTPPASIASST